MDLRNPEQAWRVMWMRAIARTLPGPGTVPGGWTGRDCRTLFVRYERIGDMIMATGIIRVLARAVAGGKVDVVANPSTLPVLNGNPHVGRIFTLDKSWKSYVSVGRELRAERYDVIVDGRINNPKVFTSTPLLMRAAGAPYRVGAGGGNNDLVYNVRVPAYDRVTPYIEASKALAVPFGVDIEAVDWRPEIFLSANEAGAAETEWEKASAMASGERTGSSMPARRLLVNLSASEPKRRWEDEKFVDVLRRVRGTVPEVSTVVMGLPREWSRVERVAGAVGARPVATPKLRQALAMVGTSDLVFTPDTSISHAASAFSKPAVVLLKRDHHPYAPYDIPGEIVFWDGNEISSLPSNTVGDAVERLVRKYGR